MKLYLILILLMIPIVSAGTFQCVETEICDEYGAEFVMNSISDIVDCYSNNVGTVSTEEIFTVHSPLVYSCSGTESFSKEIRIYYKEVLSTGQVYQDDDYIYTFDVDCTGAGQYWAYNAFLVHDLNTARSNIETQYYYVIDGTSYNCPTDSYSVSDNNPSLTVSTIYDTNDVYSVFQPYPKIYPKTIERGFGINSLLSMYSYYYTDYVINDNVINDWVDDLCSDDVCSYMPTTSQLINYIESKGLDTITISDTTNVNGYTLITNKSEVLKHLFSQYTSPILMRLEIQWDYYNSANGFPIAESFTGYKYYMLLLGYDELNDRYLVQTPEGDRYWYSSSLLTTRWGAADYDGFLIEKPTSSSVLSFVLKGDNTDKLSGNILINGFDYYLENDLTLEYHTSNPFVFLYLDDDYTADLVSKQTVSDLFSNTDIESDDIDILIFSKQNNQITNIPLSFLNDEDMLIDNEVFENTHLTEETESFQIYFDTNFYADLEVVLSDYANTESVTIIKDIFTLNHDYNFDLTDITNNHIFNEGTYLNLSITATDKGTGIIKKKDIDITTNILYMNYDMDLNPRFPIYCQTNNTCLMFDDETLSEIGTYQVNYGTTVYDDQLVGSQTVDWDNGDIDSHYYVAIGNIENFDYEFTDSTIYTTEGTYNVEYCLTSRYDNNCYETTIIVLDNIIGGGQSGGDVSESETGACVITLTDDFNYIGCLENLIVEEFFTDTLNFDYPLPTGHTFQIDLEDEAYCYNGNTIYEHIEESQTLYKHTCFDFSNYNDCGVDISYLDFLNIYSFEIGTPYKTIDLNYCLVDGSWIACDSSLDFYTGNSVPDESIGFCTTTELEYNCNYDCSIHDIDNDGYNDCDDICCGYDDTVNSDGDSLPNGCDNCPYDQDNDIDNDNVCGDVDNCVNNYNPNQYDTDNDGFGNVCDICEGGDDNIDNDNNGIPDYCESNGNGDGDGDGDEPEDISLYNTCHNGVIDSHIGETEIDYGGDCGICTDNELSLYIDETGIDYGGVCGFCIPNSNKQNDAIWQQIPNKNYPFDTEQCSQGQGVLFFPFFILIIIFGFLLIIPIFLGLFVIIWLFRKKRSQKNKKYIKKVYHGD